MRININGSPEEIIQFLTEFSDKKRPEPQKVEDNPVLAGIIDAIKDPSKEVYAHDGAFVDAYLGLNFAKNPIFRVRTPSATIAVSYPTYSLREFNVKDKEYPEPTYTLQQVKDAIQEGYDNDETIYSLKSNITNYLP